MGTSPAINPNNYSVVAKFFHWAIAIMIIFNLICGPILVYFDDFSTNINLFNIHKQLGVTILILAILRLIWRLTHRYPTLDGIVSPLDKLVAGMGHFLLYLFMLAIPISGILFSQSFAKEVPFLWFNLPQIIKPQSLATGMNLLAIHKYLAIILTLILIGHIGAALFHHFVKKNVVLQRMLPKFCQRS